MPYGECLGRILVSAFVALMVSASPAFAQSPATSRVAAAAPVIVGVKHVSVPVRDQDQALVFYTEKLGFEVAHDEPIGPGLRWIELAIPRSPTRVLLITGPEIEKRIGSFTNVVFLSHDVTASYASMRALGVEFDTPPVALPGGGESAVFRDPDGNTFALATGDEAEEPVMAGRWSGALEDSTGHGLSLVADIVAEPGPGSVTLVIRGTSFRTRGVRLQNATIRFIWEPGPVVVCFLHRQPTGVFDGECVDTEEGDGKRLTLTPPGH